MRLAIAASLLAAGATSGEARAADAEACIVAHEEGLSAERQARLIEARERFAACVAEGCPDVVRTECERKLSALRERVPSLIVAVVGPEGDVAEGTIEVDDRRIGRLDGRAFEIDPGRHELEVATPLGRAATSIVAREGERGRRITLQVGQAPKVAPEPLSDPPLVHPAAWILGGLGLAGMTVFAVAGGLGLATEKELEGCAPRCAQSEIDVMRDRYLVADVGLLVGAVGLAGGLVVGLALAPAGDRSTALVLGPGELALRGAF